MSNNANFFDVSKFKKRLEKLGQELKNMQPVMKKISGDMKTKTDMCFRNSRDPYGNKWEKLKNRKGKPLIDSGSLRSSVSSTSGKDYAVVGTNKKYAKTHQFGIKKGYNGKKTVKVDSFTRKVTVSGYKRKRKQIVKAHERTINLPWGNIPARPFIGISKRSMMLYSKWMKEYLTN